MAMSSIRSEPLAYPALKEQLRSAGIEALERYLDAHGKELANPECSGDASHCAERASASHDAGRAPVWLVQSGRTLACSRSLN